MGSATIIGAFAADGAGETDRRHDLETQLPSHRFLPAYIFFFTVGAGVNLALLKPAGSVPGYSPDPDYTGQVGMAMLLWYKG